MFMERSDGGWCPLCINWTICLTRQIESLLVPESDVSVCWMTKSIIVKGGKAAYCQLQHEWREITTFPSSQFSMMAHWTQVWVLIDWWCHLTAAAFPDGLVLFVIYFYRCWGHTDIGGDSSDHCVFLILISKVILNPAFFSVAGFCFFLYST